MMEIQRRNGNERDFVFGILEVWEESIDIETLRWSG